MDKSLQDYFEKHAISYKLHEHPAVFTVAESREIKKHIPAMQTKSLFLKANTGQFYLICMQGEKRLNMNAIRKQLHVQKLRFATKEELWEHLHVAPGSVSIFTMIHPETVILLLDKSLWEAEAVGFHPNVNTATLEVSHENLERFYNSLSAEKHIITIENE